MLLDTAGGGGGVEACWECSKSTLHFTTSWLAVGRHTCKLHTSCWREWQARMTMNALHGFARWQGALPADSLGFPFPLSVSSWLESRALEWESLEIAASIAPGDRGRDRERLGLRRSSGTNNWSDVSNPSKETSRNTIPLSSGFFSRDGIGIVGKVPAGGTASVQTIMGV